MTADSQFFFESRYYEQGEKFYSFGKRPSWAPDRDWVGIKQPDKISVQQDDIVLELARFKNGDSIVNWVGLYGKSIDKHYGDRGGTTQGLGIWIRDSVVINSEFLGELLYSILIYQDKKGDLEAVAKALNSHKNELSILPYAEAGEYFANASITAKFATGSLHDSLIWFSEIDALDPKDPMLAADHLGSFITLFQLLNRHFVKNDRLLLVLSRDKPTRYTGSKFQQLLPSTKFSTFTELSRMICVSSETVNEDLNKLKTEVSRLETENSKHRAQVETLSRKLDQGSIKFSGDTASISSDRVLTNMQQELSKLGRRLHVKERQDAKDSFYSLVNFFLLVVLVVVSAGISIWQSRDIITQTNEIRRSVNEINQREFQNQARESGEEEPVDSNVGVASETCVDTSDDGPCEDEDGS